MKQTTEVSVFKVGMHCSEEHCFGEMLPTGVVLTSNPPQYGHRCEECGKVRNYREEYPIIKYVEKE